MTSYLDKNDDFDLFYLIPDTDIIPKIGNFSFIKAQSIRESLTFDYNYFVKIGASELLKENKKENKNFWGPMKYMCYHKHTEETYQNNLFYLEFIAIHGWTEFVILYLNSFF